MAVTARPGSAPRRDCAPIAGLIGLGLGRRHQRPDRPKGGQKLLASIYDLLGNGAGAEALRNGQGDQFFAKLLLAAIALLVGVGGIWLLFTAASSLVEPCDRGRDRILPLVFIAPALVAARGLPRVSGGRHGDRQRLRRRTAPSRSPTGRASPRRPFLEILRNNILWLLIATAGSVGLGLLTAALFDRIRRESLAKIFVFLPLAISLVGATVIWKFVYAWQPPSQPQFGLLNAVWTAFGGQPIPWATRSPSTSRRRW